MWSLSWVELGSSQLELWWRWRWHMEIARAIILANSTLTILLIVWGLALTISVPSCPALAKVEKLLARLSQTSRSVSLSLVPSFSCSPSLAAAEQRSKTAAASASTLSYCWWFSSPKLPSQLLVLLLAAPSTPGSNKRGLRRLLHKRASSRIHLCAAVGTLSIAVAPPSILPRARLEFSVSSLPTLPSPQALPLVLLLSRFSAWSVRAACVKVLPKTRGKSNNMRRQGRQTGPRTLLQYKLRLPSLFTSKTLSFTLYCMFLLLWVSSMAILGSWLKGLACCHKSCRKRLSQQPLLSQSLVCIYELFLTTLCCCVTRTWYMTPRPPALLSQPSPANIQYSTEQKQRGVPNCLEESRLLIAQI